MLLLTTLAKLLLTRVLPISVALLALRGLLMRVEAPILALVRRRARRWPHSRQRGALWARLAAPLAQPAALHLWACWPRC
jgi:hypothetical protein